MITGLRLKTIHIYIDQEAVPIPGSASFMLIQKMSSTSAESSALTILFLNTPYLSAALRPRKWDDRNAPQKSL